MAPAKGGGERGERPESAASSPRPSLRAAPRGRAPEPGPYAAARPGPRPRPGNFSACGARGSEGGLGSRGAQGGPWAGAGRPGGRVAPAPLVRPNRGSPAPAPPGPPRGPPPGRARAPRVAPGDVSAPPAARQHRGAGAQPEPWPPAWGPPSELWPRGAAGSPRPGSVSFLAPHPPPSRAPCFELPLGVGWGRGAGATLRRRPGRGPAGGGAWARRLQARRGRARRGAGKVCSHKASPLGSGWPLLCNLSASPKWGGGPGTAAGAAAGRPGRRGQRLKGLVRCWGTCGAEGPGAALLTWRPRGFAASGGVCAGGSAAAGGGERGGWGPGLGIAGVGGLSQFLAGASRLLAAGAGFLGSPLVSRPPFPPPFPSPLQPPACNRQVHGFCNAVGVVT